jgi:sigma-B regulation protein RsbU (phosphoserine phosphatase)
LRRLTIRQRIILLMLALNVTLTAVLSVSMYRNERAVVLRETDEKLFTAATGIAELFPDDYHARITGPESISDAEYQAYSKRLTGLARRNKFQRLYTYMELNGAIVTTAMSAEPDDPTKVVPFFTVYRLPSEKIRRAFAERTPFFDEYTDEFGPTLSAFVPYVTSNGKVFVAGADVSSDFIAQALRDALRRVALLSVTVFAVFVIVSSIVADRLSRSIRTLVRVTTAMADGGFALTPEQTQWLERMSHGSSDEVATLSDAFLRMDAKLQEHIVHLRETTAAKEAIESELNIARSIQDSFLQKIFPTFPDRTEFDLVAALEPAKEVGGDLYDFVLLDDDRLYFCVGDVAGKGVPAALMMVVTLTLMRAAAEQTHGDPASTLAKVNADILEKNETMLFVTMFCGVLTLSTGELRFSNAGHNPPIIRRRDGRVEWLKLPPGVVLGVTSEATYATSVMTFEAGDTLLAYTDGVTEAHDPLAVLYSDDALFALVGEQPNGSPAAMVAAVMRRVKAHVGTAPQSDDITALALVWNGR